jgi:hypothetical protein
VTLEIVDGRLDGRLARECERLDEGQRALISGLLRERSFKPLARLGDEPRRARLDQEEKRRCAPGGRAAQELLPVEQPPELVCAHQAASWVATSR